MSKHTSHILLAIISIFFFGCSSIPKLNNKHIIIYRVFDSLENYLVNDIQKNAPNKPLGVVVDPICKNCQSGFEGRYHTGNLYSIAIVYNFDSSYDKQILKKTNRYFQIGSRLYPVYIMWVDDMFLSSPSSLRNYSSKYEVPYPIQTLHDFIFVDMALKTFIPPRVINE